MNINHRFNELINNYDPTSTTIFENKFETDKYILHETRIEHDIYSNYEGYDRIKIYNKQTNCARTYYLDSINDLDVYALLYFKLSEFIVDEPKGTKRNSEDDIDIDQQFKRIKIVDTSYRDDIDDINDIVITKSDNSDEIIEDIQKALKRKRHEDKYMGYDSDDEQINKKRKIES